MLEGETTEGTVLCLTGFVHATTAPSLHLLSSSLATTVLSVLVSSELHSYVLPTYCYATAETSPQPVLSTAQYNIENTELI